LLSLIASSSATAQHHTPAAREVSPFRPLDLPAPNDYRAADGRPGPEYWQQRVDYKIEATLDPETNVLSGTERITYTNNSPMALPYLWLHLEQNICAPNSIANTLDQPPLVFGEAVFDFSCQGFEGGVTLGRIESDGRPLDHQLYGVTMRIDLPEPLASGAIIEFEIDWSSPMPEYGAARMGRDGELYEIAWWYPRLAVYDDVKGWNHEPYIGAGEFYLEYGAFDVELTVPARFVVVATGELQNPEDVLTATQRERLARAMATNQPVAVITADEAGTSATRPTTDGMLTWHFAADSVRGFAFAMAPNFRWDATSWDGISIQTLYRPEATLWEEGIRMAEQTIRHFSEKWYRYPYPHATTVEGPIAGMEYPMLTFVPPGANREELQWVLMHELGHEWFPMIVGSNERLHPWMDEGFNTFIDSYGQEEYFAGTVYGDTLGQTPLHEYDIHALPGVERPMGLRPVEQTDLFWIAYRKPTLMLRLLREEVVGAERFDRAFRAYTDAWAFKHPTPADFFRMMRDGSGMDLDWFWRDWIYSTARLDHAIADIQSSDDGTEIVIENRGDMEMPVELELTYGDGTTERIKLPVEMWNQGDMFVYRVAAGREVTSARLDPRGVYPDVDRGNDVMLSGACRRSWDGSPRPPRSA
jgi:hypothetical protein